RRGEALKQKSKCKRGHPLRAPNLIFRTRDGKQVRECRKCANSGFRDRRAANKKRFEQRDASIIGTTTEEHVMEQDVAKPATTIDPMGFLGEAQPAPDAAEHLEESQGEI